jgi:hypothetical protein
VNDPRQRHGPKKGCFAVEIGRCQVIVIWLVWLLDDCSTVFGLQPCRHHLPWCRKSRSTSGAVTDCDGRALLLRSNAQLSAIMAADVLWCCSCSCGAGVGAARTNTTSPSGYCNGVWALR